MYALPIRDGNLTVDPEALDNLMVQAATTHNGGTFPAGANGLWHGGVHIGPPAEGIQFHAPVPGTIIAARLGADDTDLYGSPNFILTRHTWPPFAEEGEAAPFYMLFMHGAGPDVTGGLAAVGRSAEQAPWLITTERLRVAVPTLRVRSNPSTDADVKMRLTRGEAVPITGEPTEAGGYRWYPVDAPGIPYTVHVAEQKLGGDRLAERIGPSIREDAVESLKRGEVTRLDQPVAAGTQLWWTGTFGFPDAKVVDGFPLGELFRRSPTLHWEVFAGEPVLGHEDGAGDGTEVGAWNAAKDDNNDYVMDPSEVGMLYNQMEQLWSESGATEVIDAAGFASATPEERLPFYIQTSPLRRTAAKFRSEWDIQDEEVAMDGLQWWGEAAGAGVDLPSDSKTWHYHPVGALEAVRPRFTVERNGTTLDGTAQTIQDVAEKVIADLDNVSGDLSGLSESEFERVRKEMNYDQYADSNLQVNVAAPATEEPEEFAHVFFVQSDYGYRSLNGSTYFLGIFVTSTGENDPDLYEMLKESGPAAGVPGRTPPDPGEGGPHPDNRWTGESGWFGGFEQGVWASITESEGSLKALNTYDTAFLSVGPVQQTAGAGEAKGELQGALDTLKQNAPEAYWRHFGRFGLQPVAPSIQTGAKKAHFKLRGERLDTGEKKERLRSFKWAYLFQRAMENPTVRYWMMREGFERLQRLQNREFTIQVSAENGEAPREFDAALEDIFSRGLSQALLLDWHVNSPADVWAGHPPTHDNYDQATGNNWLTPVQNKFGTWGIATASDLPLTETQEFELVAAVMNARIGNMSGPARRAIGILKYTENETVERLATTTQPREAAQTVPAFLSRVLNLNDNPDHTGEGAWTDIQGHGATSLSFASA